MSHSPLCLWKKKVISSKLRRDIEIGIVHILCDYLLETYGLPDSDAVAKWIEAATPEELEEAIRMALERSRKRKKMLATGESEAKYAYSYIG